MTQDELVEILKLKRGDPVWVEWCKQVARCRLLTLKQPPEKVWKDYQSATNETS